MRYHGGTDIDRSYPLWTQVALWIVNRSQVSHATPPHLVKVKINFDEAQKLKWKEIKCLYGLIKITTNHISELQKIQLEFEKPKCSHLGDS